MTNTQHLIYLLDSTYTVSFRNTGRVLYKVDFENSNVLTIIEKLKQLHHNVENNICTGKHVGYIITVNDVNIVMETMNKLVNHYQTINNLTALPTNLKLYTMEKEIRQSTTDNEMLPMLTEIREIFKPTLTDKLTPKQKRVKKSKVILSKLIKKD